MKYNRNVYQALMMITQFGINMLVPIFICTFLGILIDRRLETSGFTVALFFLGALAGFTNIFRFAKKIYQQPAVTRKRSTDKEGKQSESAKEERGN
ncbi:MAG: AtpZ/AtpI family protein [Clostridiales bacterium]|nr:AtpZ/AtpI family protein [Clostridiales bacterium]